MASRAYSDYLMPLLVDADNLIDSWALLSANPASGSTIDCLLRATVIACVSAWEAYVEQLVLEAVNILRPKVSSQQWSVLNATVRSAIGRFNTPNTDQVRGLISDAIGLQNIQKSWNWMSATCEQAQNELRQVMEHRHEIAHGINPRPMIDVHYAGHLPTFFDYLGRATDAAIREYLENVLSVPNPWPL